MFRKKNKNRLVINLDKEMNYEQVVALRLTPLPDSNRFRCKLQIYGIQLYNEYDEFRTLDELISDLIRIFSLIDTLNQWCFMDLLNSKLKNFKFESDSNKKATKELRKCRPEDYWDN